MPVGKFEIEHKVTEKSLSMVPIVVTSYLLHIYFIFACYGSNGLK